MHNKRHINTTDMSRHYRTMNNWTSTDVNFDELPLEFGIFYYLANKHFFKSTFNSSIKII